jgi:peroxiredoxin
MLKFGAAFVAAISLNACGDSSGRGAAAPTAPGTAQGGAATTSAAKTGGSAAQDFSTRDVNGKTVRLGDFLGKKAIVLNFWSTFCEPCLAEFPHIKRIHEANKSKGLVVLAISMDGPETIANVPSFVKRNDLTFPVLLDEDSHIASLYNPKKSAPLSVLIDKNGKVTSIREGYNPGDEVELEREVQDLLK